MKPPTIKKFLASLLLIFFTISIIPKSVFHDLLASHTDAVTCEHLGEKQACVHSQSFKCSFNDLVVTAPYISFAASFSFNNPVILSSFSFGFYTFILPKYFFGTENRGPPALTV